MAFRFALRLKQRTRPLSCVNLNIVRNASFYNAAVAGLSEDEAQFRDVVNTFASKEIAPRAEEIDKTNTFPIDLWPALGSLGLHGLTVSEKHSGTNLGYFHHVLAMECLSTYSGSVALSYGAHSNLCVNQIERWGTPAQKDKYLTDLVLGKKVGALAMSEPGAGSDVVSMSIKAIKTQGGWRLTGNKFWITNGPVASTLIVYAKTSPEEGSKGITAFIIEKGFEGFSTGQKLDKFGMRGSDTCELIFENCFVPDENVLGEVNKGARVLMSGLDLERLVLSGGPLGLMQAAFDYAVEYVHQRKQFGQPVGTFQLMQGKIADMYTSLNASRSYVYSVARACDRGQVSRRDCAGAILYSTEKAIEVTMEGMQCLGGNGYINDYPMGRFLRDARLYAVGAGTQEIRRWLIGREFNQELLGLYLCDRNDRLRDNLAPIMLAASASFLQSTMMSKSLKIDIPKNEFATHTLRFSPLSVPVSHSPRQRTPLACDACRRRKTKCSGDRPVCGRCSARGIVCEYADRELRQHRRFRRLRGSVSSLEFGEESNAIIPREPTSPFHLQANFPARSHFHIEGYHSQPTSVSSSPVTASFPTDSQVFPHLPLDWHSTRPLASPLRTDQQHYINKRLSIQSETQNNVRRVHSFPALVDGASNRPTTSKNPHPLSHQYQGDTPNNVYHENEMFTTSRQTHDSSLTPGSDYGTLIDYFTIPVSSSGPQTPINDPAPNNESTDSELVTKLFHLYQEQLSTQSINPISPASTVPSGSESPITPPYAGTFTHLNLSQDEQYANAPSSYSFERTQNDYRYDTHEVARFSLYPSEGYMQSSPYSVPMIEAKAEEHYSSLLPVDGHSDSESESEWSQLLGS